MNCGSGCSACSSGTVCRNCTGTTDLFDGSSPGSCVTSCSATGKYTLTKTSGINHDTCSDCGANCDVCASDISCTTCNSNYQYKDGNAAGSCISTCNINAGKFLDSGTCYNCASNCKTCNAATAIGCTACNDGYYRDTSDNNVCKACHANC